MSSTTTNTACPIWCIQLHGDCLCHIFYLNFTLVCWITLTQFSRLVWITSNLCICTYMNISAENPYYAPSIVFFHLQLSSITPDIILSHDHPYKTHYPSPQFIAMHSLNSFHMYQHFISITSLYVLTTMFLDLLVSCESRFKSLWVDLVVYLLLIIIASMS